MLDQTAKPLVEVSDLKMYFPIYSGVLRRHTGDVKAVDGVSFNILEGETLGLVGESGCGKSTVGRALLRLYEPTAGSVVIGGEDIATLAPEALRKKRPSMQMVFQDPQASLNPRMTVAAHHFGTLGRTYRLDRRAPARTGVGADGCGGAEPPLCQPLSA